MLEIKSKLIEVERKYKTHPKDWDGFITTCKKLNPIDELQVSGPDTYYMLNDLVLRWRLSEDTSELTIKSRYSLSSSLVREESEVLLSDNSIRAVLHFLNRLGFKKLFRIYKHCHIFWFADALGTICAVIYKVESKGKKPKFFLELEAEKGLSIGTSKELIRKWEKILDLKAYNRVNESLYEIYSGNVTRLIDKTAEDLVSCIKCGEFKRGEDFYPAWLKKAGSKCKDCCILQNSSEAALAKVAIRARHRRKTDLSFRLKTQLRNRINSSLKNKKKVGSAVTGLGCTVEDLKKHLESKFYIHPESGKVMLWNTWGWGPGKWQIDHIKPLSSFNLEDRLEFLKACHFTNLQPLWFEDHMEKTKKEMSR